MYFLTDGLRKTSLNKCLKSLISEDSSASDMALLEETLKLNTVEIWTTAPLRYLLITAKTIQFEKSLLMICKILGQFVNPLNADDKYSLLFQEDVPPSSSI